MNPTLKIIDPQYTDHRFDVPETTAVFITHPHKPKTNSYEVFTTRHNSSDKKNYCPQIFFSWASSILSADKSIHSLEAKGKFIEKLRHLKETLKENWDGEGALPIEEQAYANTLAALERTSSAMLQYWRLAPDINGTISLSPKDKSLAGISIGNEQFSYAVYRSPNQRIYWQEPFSAEAFCRALRIIHEYLGYV